MKNDSILNNNVIKNAEKILSKETDIKFYRMVTQLLEKGYLLDDISAAFLKELYESGKLKESGTGRVNKRRNVHSQNKTKSNKKAEQTDVSTFKKGENNLKSAKKKKYYKSNKKQIKETK
jgi:hypothetical protein